MSKPHANNRRNKIARANAIADYDFCFDAPVL
jgi:hypothetical protein